MAVYRDMYGASAPSPEMAASIHEHFYEQMQLVPKMKPILTFYDMSNDKIGSGVKTYPWLLDQLRKLMDRDRENYNLDTRMMTLNQRGSYERRRRNNNNNAAPGYKGSNKGGPKGGNGNGGKGNGGHGGPNLGLPTDILKNGMMKKDKTCNYVAKGQRCPYGPQGGCPYSHKQPKAAPAQPVIAPGAPGAKAKAKPWPKRKASRNRSATPGPHESGRSPGPHNRESSAAAKERQKNQVCFVFSRGLPCKKEKENPPCYRQHRALTDPEKLARDKYEQALEKAGKTIPYARTPAQAQAAAANVKAANGGVTPRSEKGNGKGKKGGKGKEPQPCWNWTSNKSCPFGANCKFKAITPGHP